MFKLLSYKGEVKDKAALISYAAKSVKFEKAIKTMMHEYKL
jgi:hypothetical protein